MKRDKKKTATLCGDVFISKVRKFRLSFAVFQYSNPSFPYISHYPLQFFTLAKSQSHNFVILKRTSVQKSNKNEIFMARVKNSNCLKFCTQVDPCKTRKTVFLKYVFFLEKNELFAFTLLNRWIGS